MLVLVVGYGIGVSQSQLETAQVSEESSDVVTPEATNPVPSTNTSDAEEADSATTYTNPTYGYSFTLPSGWVTKSTDTKDPSFNGPDNEAIHRQIMLGTMYGEGYVHDLDILYEDSVHSYFLFEDSRPRVETLAEYLERETLVSEAKPITFAGLPAYSAVVGGFGAYYSIFVEHGGHFYVLNFGDRNEPTADQQKIIDSFKFL